MSYSLQVRIVGIYFFNEGTNFMSFEMVRAKKLFWSKYFLEQIFTYK